MNEQTRELIEKLAAQFGTTAEHLWGVLIRQAPITSTVAAVGICAWALLLLGMYRFIREKTKPGGQWDDDFGGDIVPWLVWGAVVAISAGVVAGALPTIVAGFLNPEYWAIERIIGR